MKNRPQYFILVVSLNFVFFFGALASAENVKESGSKKQTEVSKELPAKDGAAGPKTEAENKASPKTEPKPPGKVTGGNNNERVRGVTLGFQTGYALESFKGTPVGVDGGSVQPPILTVRFGYNPRFKALFQPIVNLGASALPGSGMALYLEAGGLLDWPGFHLSGGFAGSMTLEGGDYADTLFDNETEGAFLRGAVPLGRFYPSLEIRKRKVDKALIAVKEGIGTYTQHEQDTLIRPAVLIDFSAFKIWSAVTFYQAGNTAIGSEEFGLGLPHNKFRVYSLGGGYQLTAKVMIWLKAHHIEGIEDETAHYYQVPQLYPDFLVAKNSLFLEAQWTF